MLTLTLPGFIAKPLKDRKAQRLQAERNVAYAALSAATRRKDTRGMCAASAELQRLTVLQMQAGRR